MKKVWIFVLTTILVLGIGSTAFAAIESPADIYAALMCINASDARAERADGQRFGDLAKEDGVYEEFSARMRARKELIIGQRVEQGVLSQEEADQILEAMENCDGTLRQMGAKLSLQQGELVQKQVQEGLMRQQRRGTHKR